MLVLPNGVRHIPGALSRDEQQALVDDIRGVVGSSASVHPRHAEDRQGDERAHDQMWPAR